MPYLILAAIVIVVACLVVWLAVMAVWALGVLILRLLGWILSILVLAGGVGLLAGLLWGAVLPILTLGVMGRGSARPAVANPEEVQAGRVLGPPPQQHSAFGWDAAWPNYVPYQYRLDIRAVQERYLGWYSVLGGLVWWSRGLLLPVALGAGLGLALSNTVWRLMMGLLAAVVRGGHALIGWRERTRDERARSRAKADMRCVRCFRRTALPSFRCSEPSCDVVHHDIRPGPLGLRTRICACGTGLPTSLTAAARQLQAVCPFCEADQPRGAGARPVVVIPLFGAVGAGKTQFLMSALLGVQGVAQSAGGSVTAMTGRARQFLADAHALAASREHPTKTADGAVSEALAFEVEVGGVEADLQLMDAAGERFQRLERTQQLAYFDTAPELVYVLDPFALPELRPDGGSEGMRETEQAYSVLVERLRGARADASRARLTVVVPRADLIMARDPGAVLPIGSDALRSWIIEREGDALVRRMEADFHQVEYVLVDSYGRLSAADARNPARVVVAAAERAGFSFAAAADDAADAASSDAREPVGQAAEGTR